MVFSSAIFLFGFLPLTLTIYYLVPKKIRNYILLFFSLIFYAWGGPKFLLVMLAIVFANYLCALLVDRYRKSAKLFLMIGIIISLGVLSYFKYTNFYIETFNNVFNLDMSALNIVLPIGISFFTFQAMSYLIDVYRKKVKVQKNPLLVLLYVSLFPQLIAGPIVRYEDVEKEITKRNVTVSDFTEGLERFILGFAKKIIIANQMGRLADIVFDSSTINTPIAWLGAIAYMAQIYFDFSAYSDMAIGIGRMLGFHFLENFNFPYISKSITEFWRRWHISLSTWFRDYVYIPLGGNKKGTKRQIINLAIVWILTGLWHGASWNFVLWGIYYLVILLLEKFVLKKVLNKLPSFLAHIYSLIIILFGWVLFRCETLQGCINFIKTMIIPTFNASLNGQALVYLETYYPYFILAIIFSMPIYKFIINEISKIKNRKIFAALNILKYIGLVALFLLSIAFLTQSSYNPFIYFRF
ncbi:MAG TPA: MBOAT family O-acyltransferase [Bacilli bacterium]|nr:MBOAT family O-acyltransferase [Bacilli bacterium]